MPGKARCIFIASMDVDPDKEALFNEVYETEHIPLILKVPGVVSARRFKNEPLVMMMGGKKQTFVVPDEPKYSAVYELESPEVLLSDAFAQAVDAGRWPTEVRPFTKNRRHTMRRLIEG